MPIPLRFVLTTLIVLTAVSTAAAGDVYTPAAPDPTPLPAPDVTVGKANKRPAEAFSETALVEPLLDPDEKDRQEKAGELVERPTLEDYAAEHGTLIYDARFDGAAHFPLPKFGLQGDPLFEEGVVVYEGMRLVVTPDGRYEVSFIASTRGMPVALRLQLFVVEPHSGRRLPLTLPPIRIVPERGFDGNLPGQVFRVRQAGCSRALGEMFGDLHCCIILREGTARFGSWPEGINQFARLPR